MTALSFDLTREFIVRHNHELRSLLVSVGKFLPEKHDHLSFAHLEPAHVAAITAFCGTTEFTVVECAILPGFTERQAELALAIETVQELGLQMMFNSRLHNFPDRARVLVQPISGSNFSAANSICQPILQQGSLRSLAEQEIPAVNLAEPTKSTRIVTSLGENRGIDQTEIRVGQEVHRFTGDAAPDLPPPLGITSYLPWMRAASA